MANDGQKMIFTVEDAINKIGVGRAQFYILFLAAGGYLAVCSEILVCIFSQAPCTRKWNINNNDFAWLFFSTSVASAIGSLIFGHIGDRHGRKLPFIISIGISGSFALATAFSTNFWMFMILRSCVSVGIGGLFAVDFNFLIEFLPKKSRGCFVILVTFCGSLGAMFTAGLAWIFLPSDEWQLFLIFSAVPLLIIFFARLWLNVESPSFLVSIGKHNEAMKVLRWIAKQNNKEFPFNDFKLIVKRNNHKHSILSLFSSKHALQTVKLSSIWFLQSVGYWGSTTFFPNYFKEFNAPVYLDMFTNLFATLPGHCLAIILINIPNIGRLWTLRVFSLGCVLSLLLMTFLQNKIAVSVLSVISYFFMVPIYATLEVYTPECYPPLLRSTMMSLVSLVISIPNMASPFLAAKIISSSKHWIFPFVWSMCFLLQFLIEMTLYKETLFASIDNSSCDDIQESECHKTGSLDYKPLN